MMMRRRRRMQYWVDPRPCIVLGSKNLGEVDTSCYSDSCIPPGGRISDEVSSRVWVMWLAFTDLWYLFRRWSIRLSTKDRVYITAVRLVLLWDPKTWQSQKERIRTLSVFVRRSLCNIARIWQNLISISEVRAYGIGSWSSVVRTVADFRLEW